MDRLGAWNDPARAANPDWNDPEEPDLPKPYCGVYWIITTCLTGIAIGIWLGMVLWLISGEHR